MPMKSREILSCFSRVPLVLAHDSTAARTNAGAETHISRALMSVSS
jgi:hypothetical protein